MGFRLLDFIILRIVWLGFSAEVSTHDVFATRVNVEPRNNFKLIIKVVFGLFLGAPSPWPLQSLSNFKCGIGMNLYCIHSLPPAAHLSLTCENNSAQKSEMLYSGWYLLHGLMSAMVAYALGGGSHEVETSQK